MNERRWNILADSFPKLLGYGVRVTVPLTIFSFAIALTAALIVALIQYANVKVLRQICRFYIWITRGTPLLVQLYIVFFGLPGIGIRLDAFVARQANHQDGIWYPPRNMHSDMQWNMPYLGWTNRYGNDVRHTAPEHGVRLGVTLQWPKPATETRNNYQERHGDSCFQYFMYTILDHCSYYNLFCYAVARHRDAKFCVSTSHVACCLLPVACCLLPIA